MNKISYVMKQIPLTEIDKINRKAAGQGSVWYAQQAASADYNGHYITVSYKPYAMAGPIWNAEYHWGERVVLGRGSFKSCLEAALQEYKRGARGTVVDVRISDGEGAEEDVQTQKDLCESMGLDLVPVGNKSWEFARA